MSAEGAALLDCLAPVEGDGSALSWLRSNGLPSPRDESWRYTPLGDIFRIDFTDGASNADSPLDAATVDRLAGECEGPRLVFVAGRFVAGLSVAAAPSDGVVVLSEQTLGATPGDVFDPPVEGSPLTRYDGFRALNRAAGRDGAVIRVSAGVRLDMPIHIVHLSTTAGASTVSYPRVLIEVCDGADATVIETYAGLGSPAFVDASTVIEVGVDATLSHYRIQNEPHSTIHLGHTSVLQGDRSTVRSRSVMLGASIARQEIDVVLVGDDATIELDGLYLAAGAQRHDTAATVEHLGSGGTSRQLFKGVIDDAARGSFSGRIIVQPGTMATDAAQTSRSLLMSPTAQADTRPWLEIFADDVACTHGATIGRLDDEALFYLRTRGIAEAPARAMLIDAFVAEVTDAIAPPLLRRHVQDAVAASLAEGHR